MGKLILAITAIALFGYLGCNTAEKNSPPTISEGIELSVEPGEHWLGKKKVFIFSVNSSPQMAAWIENNQGQYISTIIVTNRSAKKNWIFAPKEGRPEALPVWTDKIQNNAAQIDGVSAASSKGAVDVHIEGASLIAGQEYNVYLEINHSFDYNDTWPKKENDVNGQPSLLYHAQFIAGTPGQTRLEPIGHGTADGSDGNIVMGLEGITTALTIIKNVYIMIH